MGNFNRALKHVSRAITKPFSGANKENLKALDKVIPGLVTLGPPNNLRFGRFDFTWLLLLDQDQLTAFKGEWEAVLQAEVARTSGGRVVPLNPGTRQLAFASTHTPFWNSLQKVKDEYRKIAKDSVGGLISWATNFYQAKSKSLSDAVHQNALIGHYFTQFDAADFAYEDAHKHGAQNETERKILAIGGLYKVVKLAYKTGKSLVISIATAGTAVNEVRKTIQNGAQLLNTVGGLAAGIIEKIQGKEADFRRISARVGLEGDLEALKKKLPIIGQEDLGSLAQQIEAGPRNLRASGEQTLVELDTLRGKLRHAQWWCENWRKDIEEMERDLERPLLMQELMQRFQQIDAGEGSSLIKPSDLAQLTHFQEQNRREAAKKVEELKSKVASYDWFLSERLKRLEDLLAAYDTRLSISRTQSRIAPAIGYSAPQQIAHAAASFDRSTLRHVTPGASGEWDVIRTRPRSRGGAPPPPVAVKPSPPQPVESLDAIVARAMQARRAAIAEDDD